MPHTFTFGDEKLSSGMHLQAVNIFQQPFKIVELRAATEEIMFIVSFKIINDGMLRLWPRITGGKFE